MTISQEVQERVRKAAQNRCGYCQCEQRYIPVRHEIEHIIPVAKGGTNDEDNLWLGCRTCNNFKGIQTHAYDPMTGKLVTLFNPREQIWHEHFSWSDDGTIVIGQTPEGRATVLALKLNNSIAVEARHNWVIAGWHPPKD